MRLSLLHSVFFFLSPTTWPRDVQDSSQVCKECGTFEVPMLVTHTTDGKHFLPPVLFPSCPEIKTRWMALVYCILFGGISVTFFLD